MGTDSFAKVLSYLQSEQDTEYYFAKIITLVINEQKNYMCFTANKTTVACTMAELICQLNLDLYQNILVFVGQSADTDDICFIEAQLDATILEGKQDDFDFIIGAI
jgi:hypothetical protein